MNQLTYNFANMYCPKEPDSLAISGLIRHLNNDELKKLLNDETSFENVVKDIPQVRNLETEKEVLMMSNKSLAEFNLSKEPQLKEAKQRLLETYEKAIEVFKEAETKKRQIEELSNQNSLDTTLAILQAAAAQSEEDSETVAEKFLDSNMEVEAFLDEFQSKRKLAHLRRIKADKMSELLNVNNQRGGSQVATNASWNPSAGGLYGNHLPRQIQPCGHRM